MSQLAIGDYDSRLVAGIRSCLKSTTYLVTIDIAATHAVSTVVPWVVQLASSPCACVPEESSTIVVVTKLFLLEVARTRLAGGGRRRRDETTPRSPPGLTPDAA